MEFKEDGMRVAKIVFATVLALALTAGAWAHPKHEHKLMGTVTAIDEKQIEIESKDGEKVTIPLTPETSYKRGEAVAKAADIEIGVRVVVFYTQDENKVKRATRILLPEADAPASQP